jgi:hypothetical protein
MKRKILLTVVKPDSERCLIDAPADRTIAFLGDAVDARLYVAATVWLNSLLASIAGGWQTW